MTSHSRCLPLFVAAVLCIAAARAGAQQPRIPATDREALVSLENEWLTATDSVTLTRILGEDFVHPVPTGDFLTRSQHVRWFTTHPPPKSIRYRFARLDVRLYGDMGIVNGTVVAADTSGRELDRTVFTDVFAYREGRWVAVNAQETSVAQSRR